MPAKAKVLATHVHVPKDDGSYVILEAGAKVPAWAADQITNPAAFADPATVDDSTDEPDTGSDA